jgi:hypothetical protein
MDDLDEVKQDRGSKRRPAWQSESIEIDPNRKYSSAELEEIASLWIKWGRAIEACPTCGEDELDPQTDPECPQGHDWARGEGAPKGHRIDDVLLENQQRERWSHETYVTDGVPDPAYASGIYSRAHRPVHRKPERRENS